MFKTFLFIKQIRYHLHSALKKKNTLTNISVKYFVFRSIHISGNFKFVHPLDKNKINTTLEVSLEVSFGIQFR